MGSKRYEREKVRIKNYVWKTKIVPMVEKTLEATWDEEAEREDIIEALLADEIQSRIDSNIEGDIWDERQPHIENEVKKRLQAHDETNLKQDYSKIKSEVEAEMQAGVEAQRDARREDQEQLEKYREEALEEMDDEINGILNERRNETGRYLVKQHESLFLKEVDERLQKYMKNREYTFDWDDPVNMP